MSLKLVRTNRGRICFGFSGNMGFSQEICKCVAYHVDSDTLIFTSLMSLVSFTFTEANTEMSYWHLFSPSNTHFISNNNQLAFSKMEKVMHRKFPPFSCCSVSNLDFVVSCWCVIVGEFVLSSFRIYSGFVK